MREPEPPALRSRDAQKRLHRTSFEDTIQCILANNGNLAVKNRVQTQKEDILMATATIKPAAAASPTAQVVEAPKRPEFIRQRSVFLAGTTTATKTEPDWREGVIRSLSYLPITIFNPLRRDWGKGWGNDIADDQFRRQCEWELDAQDKADVVAIYFGHATDAPISLLEFGLSVRSGRAVVCCPKGYSKRGNVQVVCARFGVTVVETLEELTAAVERKLRLVM